MVKKSSKSADPAPQSGWGAGAPLAPPETEQANISADPENRQPPDEVEEERPVMGLPAADPEPTKPKKSKKKDKAPEPEPDVPTAQGNVTRSHNSEGDQLISFVERIERLAEEASTVKDDMREVFAEAKGNGYDVATLRKVLARRRRGKEACDEEDALIDLYMQQVGYDG